MSQWWHHNSVTYMSFSSLTREGHICPSSPVRVKDWWPVICLFLRIVCLSFQTLDEKFTPFVGEGWGIIADVFVNYFSKTSNDYFASEKKTTKLYRMKCLKGIHEYIWLCIKYFCRVWMIFDISVLISIVYSQ